MAERLVRQPGERARLDLAEVVGTSYKRLHGWEPQEFHRGYDRDGNRVALADAYEVIVTREVEWDDGARDMLLANAQYRAGVCNCGFHVSLTDDLTNVFMPEFRTCTVCQGGVRYLRSRSKADDTYQKAHAEHPTAPELSDGRSLNMRMLPEDEATAVRARRQQSRAGAPSAAR